MKKNLLIAAMCLLGIVSCQKPGTDGPQNGADPVFKNVSQTEANLPEEGGTVTVTFEIENPVEGAQVEPVISVEWVTVASVDATSVSFTVAANESVEPRETSIFVAYADKASFNLAINQAGAVVRKTANALTSMYYGVEYSMVESDNFYTYISDKGFDDEGYAQPDAWYYLLDLYSEVQDYPRDEPSALIIPNGTYTFDANNTTEPWTFAGGYSEYFTITTDGQYGDRLAIEGGTVVVSDNKIVADLIVNGEPHHIVYEGSLQCQEARQPLFYSTLTDDYQPDYSNHDLYLLHYGDFYECGYDNYMLYIQPIVETGIGDYFRADITSNGSVMGEGLAGTYTVNRNTYLDDALQFLGGFTYMGSMQGTWFYNTYDGEYYGDMAPIIDGTIEVVDNGDGTYTVNLDLVDDAESANSITSTWTGVPIIQVAQAPAKTSVNRLNFVEVPQYAKR
ncbi:MAG: BACON domain-containing protein [Bacteroidales bacterium]|nr:BACON domain-containing protein [Bacteroidales bacterium]